ncbi:MULTISPECIES: glycosyltransferase family 4 protein [unclassified Neptuniibacter]|nr:MULTISPECIES: glycosyltransferase family 4 protein [unclassified Neptuniibacter]|tara:strand:+ start:14506 stop:15648 length:1143 start_codon:yes stop_codon:yes gene_type:complete
MLREIVRCWKQEGHIVNVLSSQPSYKQELKNETRSKVEIVDGATVYRLELPNESGKPIRRIWNAFKLGWAVFCKALWGRYDVIMVSTAPPVLGGFFSALSARLTGARFIYHCMDVHPEIGRVSGEFSNPIVYKLLLWADNWTCSRAAPVVVLSEDMENSLRARGRGDYNIQVINNFSLPSEQIIPNELPFEWPNVTLTMLFAGNVGRFQGLDILVAAMKKLRHRPDIHIVIMGEGAAKKELELQVSDNALNISFIGHHPVEIAKAAMLKADIGFVSLSKGLYRYAYPSKTMTYLEQGCPIIVAVEAESGLSRDVLSGKYGGGVSPGDSNALAEMLKLFADSEYTLLCMKENARRTAIESFSETKILTQWVDLLLKGGNQK